MLSLVSISLPDGKFNPLGSGGQQRKGQAKVYLESAVGWGYDGYGAEVRDGNGPREVEVWHHGENV